MPLQPVCGKLAVPIDSPQTVRGVFEFGRTVCARGLTRAEVECYRRDLHDYFYYVGAVCPEYFLPLREHLAEIPDEQLVNFAFPFSTTWLYLLEDAPDELAGGLIRRLYAAQAGPPLLVLALEQMLAGMCTPYSLHALAEYANRVGKRTIFNNAGFHLPHEGDAPAVPRFTRRRHAGCLYPLDGSQDDINHHLHPVGLPISAVVSGDARGVISWHYCSIDLAVLPAFSALTAPRLHLVSPPLNANWVAFCSLSGDGRYAFSTIQSQEVIDRREVAELKSIAERRQEEGRGYLMLLPYDDQLIYCNANILQTPCVVGDIGGAPGGTASVPSCSHCDTLMFYIATFKASARDYGDGFRSLFFCEECRKAACQGWLSG